LGVAHASFVLQTAGELLWQMSGGKPCWSRLDVNAYASMLKDNPFNPKEMVKTSLQLLTMFYDWLGETKQIRRGKATRKMRQLLRHCMPANEGSGSPAVAAHALN
jgi:hypothetical protein